MKTKGLTPEEGKLTPSQILGEVWVTPLLSMSASIFSISFSVMTEFICTDDLCSDLFVGSSSVETH